MPLIARDYWVSNLFGNTMYLLALSYYFVITFYGYQGTLHSVHCSSRANLAVRSPAFPKQNRGSPGTRASTGGDMAHQPLYFRLRHKPGTCAMVRRQSAQSCIVVSVHLIDPSTHTQQPPGIVKASKTRCAALLRRRIERHRLNELYITSLSCYSGYPQTHHNHSTHHIPTHAYINPAQPLPSAHQPPPATPPNPPAYPSAVAAAGPPLHPPAANY